ncbi:MAG: hypothetical protein ACU0CT_02635 [Paracoccaceae bacterium]
MTIHHPMRDAAIHIWTATALAENQPAYIARLYPYNTYPIFATGETPQEAAAKLEAIRTEALTKFEAAYIARQEALALARVKKAEKAAQEASA